MTAAETTPAKLQRDEPVRGWVLYDGECPLCLNAMAWFAPMLRRHHFDFAPLQTPWVQQKLGLKAGEPLAEMKLFVKDGRIYGGAEALAQIARRIWWAWPLFALAQIPGANYLLRAIYRHVAENRQCLGGACQMPRNHWIGKIFPLAVLPMLAWRFANQMPAWVFMWAMAFALYAGCKWLTFSLTQEKTGGTSRIRALGYLLAWPGMDVSNFLNRRMGTVTPNAGEIFFATAKILFGVVLVRFGARAAMPFHPLLAGWIGMIGVVFALHFGLFHLLSLMWRRAGINVAPVMQNPTAATSLAEFWGRRWNTAFHELVHRFTFRPFARRMGVLGATLLVFLLSGLVHELCISLPARGGYGLPTAYFLIQGIGVAIERTSYARRIGLGRGVRGWLFTVIITATPAYWLFHPTFIHNVILPMLHAFGAT